MTKGRISGVMGAAQAALLSSAAIFLTLDGAGSAAQAQFDAVIGLSSLDGTTGFRIDGADPGDQSGLSVSSAGDFNGDGFADVVIGAKFAKPQNQSYAGSSFIVFGKASGLSSPVDLSGLNGANGLRLNGTASSDLSGYSVSAAGDVNGDGLGDVIIGAPGADPSGRTYAGISYVVFGRRAAIPSAIQLSQLAGSTGFRLTGVVSGDRSGTSVSAAGDVNGDGFGDVIVGAIEADPNGKLSAGSAYVVFGQAARFASAINLSSLNGSNGFRIDGNAAGDILGGAVSSAGDVNGDGFDDVVVGATYADPNGLDRAGSAYVIFGKQGGFPAAIKVSNLNGTSGFRITGATTYDLAGFAVSGAGDVNGDGTDDLLVSAPNLDSAGGTNAGGTYVVFGHASAFPATLNLSVINGTNGTRLDGVTAYNQSGRSAAIAGDVNGDGFGDVVVGSVNVSPGAVTFAGASYVVFGKKTGFSTPFLLSSLDGDIGFRLDGEAQFDRSGRSVAGAGDVNGDGLDDVIIGANGADPAGRYSAGSTYVLYGRAPVAAVTRIGSAAAQYITGGPLGDTLQGLDGSDELEGRGAADNLVGGLGRNTASYAHAPAGLIANLGTPSENTGDAAGDTYVGILNIIGSAFDDSLRGDGGSNRITGGRGKDLMRGGPNPDIFVFRSPAESQPGLSRDRILDFNPGTFSTAVDKIDVSTIDAKAGVNGNQAFTFIGTAPFHRTGEIRVQKVGTNIIIQGNTSGNLLAEFEILLRGLTKTALFTAKDFRL